MSYYVYEYCCMFQAKTSLTYHPKWVNIEVSSFHFFKRREKPLPIPFQEGNSVLTHVIFDSETKPNLMLILLKFSTVS